MPAIRLALITFLAANLAAGCATSWFRDFFVTRTAGSSYLEEGIRNYEEEDPDIRPAAAVRAGRRSDPP